MHDLHTIFGVTRVGEAELETVTLGHLAHGGRIVACDPLSGSAETHGADSLDNK